MTDDFKSASLIFLEPIYQYYLKSLPYRAPGSEERWKAATFTQVGWFIDLFIKALFVLSAITNHHQTQLRFCEATLYFSPAVISCKSSGGFTIRLLWLPVFSKCLSADFIPENPRYQLKGKSNLFTPLLCTGNDNLLYWKVKRENKTVPEFHIIWPGPTCILQVFIPARLIVIIGSSQIPEIITLYCGGKIRLQVLWISACQNIT